MAFSVLKNCQYRITECKDEYTKKQFCIALPYEQCILQFPYKNYYHMSQFIYIWAPNYITIL